MALQNALGGQFQRQFAERAGINTGIAGGDAQAFDETLPNGVIGGRAGDDINVDAVILAQIIDAAGNAYLNRTYTAAGALDTRTWATS